jgi:1,4-alpha-glucan branching enzyme
MSANRQQSSAIHNFSLLSEDDLYLFNEGSHVQLYDKLGAHPISRDGVEGTYFAVWAPNARQVSVAGDFNGWSDSADLLRSRGSSGIFEGLISGVRRGDIYKYIIFSSQNNMRLEKSDPFAFQCEVAPRTASVVCDLSYEWQDADWMKHRGVRNALDAPMSIYEVHLGSWRRSPDNPEELLDYRQAAALLTEYVTRMGFTHVEFLPLTEHPFYGSWGYQTTGYFAATSRYGSPEDLMFLIDSLHQAGVAVILDWVPSHFPSDGHGLAFFDGTHLYEHADPRQGFHPDWNSYIFNYGRNEVRSFLLSSALFWLDKYHIDGLRVDAVASMLYLDYSRKSGEWVPNHYGGRENIAAIELLRRLNAEIYRCFPDVQTVAEESTSWPMVSRPAHLGGLGFGLKWDMGWMHDSLHYISREPIYRKFHQSELTFRGLYAFHENFVLPLSHDEVVHGKGSLLQKMPGDEWQRFANLRALFGYMFAQTGKKLLFMGAEFAQSAEWQHDHSLDWHLLQYSFHSGVQRWVRDLNHLYSGEPALHQRDCHPDGFEWIDCNDAESSVLTFLRKGESSSSSIGVFCNFTPVPRIGYRIGVPEEGYWSEVLNSDAREYGGSGMGNSGGIHTSAVPCHGKPFSLELTLPPLAVLFFRSPAPAGTQHLSGGQK